MIVLKIIYEAIEMILKINSNSVEILNKKILKKKLKVNSLENILIKIVKKLD